jgi:hypothetical protein
MRGYDSTSLALFRTDDSKRERENVALYETVFCLLASKFYATKNAFILSEEVGALLLAVNGFA